MGGLLSFATCRLFERQPQPIAGHQTYECFCSGPIRAIISKICADNWGQPVDAQGDGSGYRFGPPVLSLPESGTLGEGNKTTLRVSGS